MLNKKVGGRLHSLDFFRGMTMFLIIAAWVPIWGILSSPELEETILYTIGIQMVHHPWNGLYIGDLLQPFFMFIVGVAIPFSVNNRKRRGDSDYLILKHAIYRSFLLLLFGWAISCIELGRMTLNFRNVLSQLSLAYLIAFLIMKKPAWFQFSFSIGLLILTEVLYRGWTVDGFNEPFVPGRNFGAYIDLVVIGNLSREHWVTFNAIPTTAHTIWGLLAGLVLRSERKDFAKIRILLISGALGIVLGYLLNPITPIIKKICTSSYVIVSGG